MIHIFCLAKSNVTLNNYRFVINVIPQLTDGDFFHHFRMRRNSFSTLVEFCEENITTPVAGNMSVEEMAYITLWYLANQSCMREISLMFNRTISSVWRAIGRITFILGKNQEKFIKWPTAEDTPSISESFAQISGFPGVIGAIDGSHIPFEAPQNYQKDYNYRKCYHSLVLLAVCLPNRAFSYTFAGFPGSAHDSRVFKCSDLGKAMQEDPSQLFPTPRFHILGDSAFPCGLHLMPTIKNSLANDARKRRYNLKLSKTRIIIEHSFRDLKNTWRRLLYVKSSLKRAVAIIAACCVLNNFLIINGDRKVHYRTSDSCVDNIDLDEFADDWFSTSEGKEKRDEIIDVMWNN